MKKTFKHWDIDKIKKIKGTEEGLHKAVCDYLHAQYPDVVFITDASGIRLTPKLAKKFSKLKSHVGIPDIFIFEPKGIYHGLFMELKREGERVYKKSGDLSDEKHIQEQYQVHKLLTEKGYYGGFVIGFDRAKAIIDFYLDPKFSLD